MSLETLIDVCVACAGPGPSPVPSLLGSSSSPFTGPPPDTPHEDYSSSPSDQDTHGDRSPQRGDTDSPGSSGDHKPSLWDRLFGGDSGADIAGDVAGNVAQDLATEIALDVASQQLPRAAAAAGAAGAIVNGSGVLAEGIHEIVVKNEGRGMGGSSKSGKAAMEAAMNEIHGTNNPRRKK